MTETLEIKVGDWAVLRNGEVSGPLKFDSKSKYYPLFSGTHEWTADGRFWNLKEQMVDEELEFKYDIIATLPAAPLDHIRALEARVQKLEQALRFYASPADYAAPYTGGMGKLWEDCGVTAKNALEDSQ